MREISVRKQIEKNWELAKLRLIEEGIVGQREETLRAYRNLSLAKIFSQKEDAPNEFGVKSGSKFIKGGKAYVAICATKRKVYLIDEAISGEEVAQRYMNDAFFTEWVLSDFSIA